MISALGAKRGMRIVVTCVCVLLLPVPGYRYGCSLAFIRKRKSRITEQSRFSFVSSPIDSYATKAPFVSPTKAPVREVHDDPHPSSSPQCSAGAEQLSLSPLCPVHLSTSRPPDVYSMLSTVLIILTSLSFARAAAVAVNSTVVCSAGQCIQGFSNTTSEH